MEAGREHGEQDGPANGSQPFSSGDKSSTPGGWLPSLTLCVSAAPIPMKTTNVILLAAALTLFMVCTLTVSRNLRHTSEMRSVSAALRALPPASLVEASPR